MALEQADKMYCINIQVVNVLGLLYIIFSIEKPFLLNPTKYGAMITNLDTFTSFRLTSFRNSGFATHKFDMRGPCR